MKTLSSPRVVWGLVIAAAILSSALGTVARPAAAHAATVRAGLLTEADLPDGWIAADAPGSVPSAYAWCPGGASALPVSPIDRAGRVYSRGSISTLVYEDVLGFAPGEAEAAFAAIRAHPEPCEWADTTADVVPMTFHLGAASELQLGDEALARRLEAEWDGVSLSADVVVVRRGELVAVLAYVAVGQGSVAVDAELSRRLARMVADKLAAPTGTAPGR